MCLSANEPGGPRRCESYMRNVHSKMVELQQNVDLQRARSEQISDANRRINQIDQMDKSRLTADDREAYESLRSTLQSQMNKFSAELEKLRGEESTLRKAATTALANHNAEIERRQRMGAVIDERGNSPIDENSPYMTVSPEHFKQIENLIGRYASSGTPVDHRVRTRMVPVHMGNGSYHPFLTVEEVDVQFNSKEIQDRFGVSDSPLDMGHNDAQKWYAPTDKVLHAAYVVSDGGRNYVSQKNAEDPEYSTGGLVRNAVFSQNNASLVDQAPADVADLHAFARNYPGDTAYAQRVRAIANKDYVSPQDVSVLTSAVAGWRQYKDRKASAPRAEARQTPMQSPAPASGQQPRMAAQPSQAPRRPAQTSSFVGQVGEPIPETLMKVKVVRKFDSQFGGGKATMIIAQDNQGRTYKWNASSDLDVRDGDDISLRGIVKEHAEYNGIKQTVLTRGKMDIVHRVG